MNKDLENEIVTQRAMSHNQGTGPSFANSSRLIAPSPESSIVWKSFLTFLTYLDPEG